MKFFYRILVTVLIALGGMAILHSLYAVAEADTIYINGNVYTVNETFARASSIVVKDGRILYAGDDATAQKKYRSGSPAVDLGGKTVIPGLIESHMHYLLLGQALDRIDIFQKPKAEILAKVKAEADKLPDGEWIVSMGWNNVLWGEDYPTKEELDAVAPNNPVSLARVDGHSSWFNSLALQIAGIDKNTPNPQGGEILKKPNGEVWGILTDTAANLVQSKIPNDASDARKLFRFTLAGQSVISYGITTLVDAGAAYNSIKILKSAYADGTLKVRAYEMLSEGEDIKYINDGNEPVRDLYDGKLSVAAVKLVSDGSLGSRSAWLLRDYSDRAGHVGNGRWDDGQMYRIVKRVAGRGFQIGTHAIGDAAIRQVIDVQKRVIDELGLTDHRFRIEHFQIVDAADIPRAIEYGFIPSMETVHATSDMNMAEDRVGPGRIQSSYAWRTVLENKGIIANGSDAPVELVNPYHGLYAAVTRQDRDGQPPNGWYSNQALTREEALRSFTIWGAYAAFAEKTRGSLEAGKYADFVVLDRDIMTCPAAEIKDITALKTVIGGEVVYEAGN
ncbi:MAG: amidohydrolase [Spirochaetaceae bacterium]|jgi:predicted amidohydrolase YtcJ|nr:amidohydrolase [Spirochaetaceae bacterium]